MRIDVVQGDLTQIPVDVIVNAANSSLRGGGGVDGAIHRVGGPQILAECMEIVHRRGECKTGEAVITNAGNLPSKKVIHTVGPVWKGGRAGEDEKLRSCYIQCLNLARENKLRSLAFPNISTGVYGFPKDRAARIAYESVQKWPGEGIEKVLFVCYDPENFALYRELQQTYGGGLSC